MQLEINSGETTAPSVVLKIKKYFAFYVIEQKNFWVKSLRIDIACVLRNYPAGVTSSRRCVHNLSNIIELALNVLFLSIERSEV